MSARRYKGVCIEQTGIAWTVWIDFVSSPAVIRPRFDTLTQAKSFITSLDQVRA